MGGCSSSPSKFDRNHPRQKAVTDAIVKMIVKDVQPAYTVEREGFHELVSLLEPRYTMVSRKHLQQTLLPSYYSKVEETIQQALDQVSTLASLSTYGQAGACIPTWALHATSSQQCGRLHQCFSHAVSYRAVTLQRT